MVFIGEAMYKVKSIEEWPNDGELDKFFEQWAAEIHSKAALVRRYIFVWKALAFMPIPLAVVAWIFGALNIAEDDSGSSNSGGIVLLVVGAATMFLERLKPRKYLTLAKQKHGYLYTAAVKIEYTLALPIAARKSPDILVEKTLKRLKQAGQVPGIPELQNEDMGEIAVE